MNNGQVPSDQRKNCTHQSLHLPSYPTALPTSPQSADLQEKRLDQTPQPDTVAATSNGFNTFTKFQYPAKADGLIQPHRDREKPTGGGEWGQGSGARLWDKMTTQMPLCRRLTGRDSIPLSPAQSSLAHPCWHGNRLHNLLSPQSSFHSRAAACHCVGALKRKRKKKERRRQLNELTPIRRGDESVPSPLQIKPSQTKHDDAVRQSFLRLIHRVGGGGAQAPAS